MKTRFKMSFFKTFYWKCPVFTTNVSFMKHVFTTAVCSHGKKSFVFITTCLSWKFGSVFTTAVSVTFSVQHVTNQTRWFTYMSTITKLHHPVLKCSLENPPFTIKCWDKMHKYCWNTNFHDRLYWKFSFKYNDCCTSVTQTFMTVYTTKIFRPNTMTF